MTGASNTGHYPGLTFAPPGKPLPAGAILPLDPAPDSETKAVLACEIAVTPFTSQPDSDADDRATIARLINP